MTTEKRFRPRMHRRIPLKVTLTFEGDAAGEGTLLEMSEGGLSFSSDSPVAEGSTLLFRVGDAESQVAVKGNVIHAAAKEGAGVHGVKFVDAEGKKAEEIKALIKRHRFEKFRAPGLGRL